MTALVVLVIALFAIDTALRLAENAWRRRWARYAEALARAGGNR